VEEDWPQYTVSYREVRARDYIREFPIDTDDSSGEKTVRINILNVGDVPPHMLDASSDEGRAIK
jgi:hypothetical protein